MSCPSRDTDSKNSIPFIDFHLVYLNRESFLQRLSKALISSVIKPLEEFVCKMVCVPLDKNGPSLLPHVSIKMNFIISDGKTISNSYVKISNFNMLIV